MNKTTCNNIPVFVPLNAAIGYKFERKPGHGKILVPDEPAASIIVEALEGFAAGRFETISEVRCFLLSNPGYPRDRNGDLHVTKIREMLERLLYTGYMEYKPWGITLQPGIFQVDATDLRTIFGYQKFDNIIFQFPNVGSREPVEGRNPNFILIRDFLKSAKSHLREDGKVFITTVNSSYYGGVFHFEEVAEEAGFEAPEIYSFDPRDFPEYTHSMTNEDESAIEDYDFFCTYVFRL